MKETVRTDVVKPALQARFVGLEEEELAPEALRLKDILIVILFESAGVRTQRTKQADVEKLKVKLCNLWLERVRSSLLCQR